jgi:two-component system alkaline phosphatase synthesis response regulator PhoP
LDLPSWEVIVPPKRILYIEDKIEMISLTRIFLRQKGFEVLGALGGEQGLDTIKQEKPDLVLLDLVMPGMSGWEVYKKMQADDDMAQIPVIIVSASSRELQLESKWQSMSSVVDYIAKPFAPRILVERIKRVFAQLDGPRFA